MKKKIIKFIETELKKNASINNIAVPTIDIVASSTCDIDIDHYHFSIQIPDEILEDMDATIRLEFLIAKSIRELYQQTHVIDAATDIDACAYASLYVAEKHNLLYDDATMIVMPERIAYDIIFETNFVDTCKERARFLHENINFFDGVKTALKAVL